MKTITIEVMTEELNGLRREVESYQSEIRRIHECMNDTKKHIENIKKMMKEKLNDI